MITFNGIAKHPTIEKEICSFTSITKGIGRLVVTTDIITKHVSFKVIGNTGETITDDLNRAIALYNLISL